MEGGDFGMSSVDERIVNMKIDNKQFLSGAKSSQTALNNLNKTVNNAGKGKAMAGLGASVDGVKQKFSLLNAAAVTAVATITNKVVNAGLHMAKSLTLDPIMQGYREYTTNLKAIGTIVANTGAKVPVVNKYLSALNRYSDQTIYNFSEMARNIGTFTAAGVGLKTATSAIKGIANVAALSGSNAHQASGAMYQLSQAISAGKVGAQDWNSVVNAGMAGKQLQSALARTAIAMGALNKEEVKGLKAGQALKVKGDNFKTSIMALPGQVSWLTSGVLVKGLAALDGRFSKAALSQEKLANGTLKYKNAQEVEMVIRKNRMALEKEGVKYTDKQFKDMMKMSDASFKAAQTIKDYGQMVDVIKESIGSGWAAVFQNLFGNIKQASKLWTTVGNSITNVISTVFYKVNSALAGWRSLGGYELVWKGIGNIFQALGNIIRPFVDALASILPSTGKAGSGLYSLSVGFEAATAWFEKLTQGAEGLGAPLQILAQAFKIALHVVVGVVKYFAALLPLVMPLAEGVGQLATDISEVVVGFLKMADVGGAIDGLFQRVIDGRQNALGPIVETIGDIVAALGRLVHGDVSGFTDQFKQALTNLTPLGEMVSNVMGKMQAGFAQVANSGGIIGKIGSALSTAAGKVKEFADNLLGAFDAFKSGSAAAAQGSTEKMAATATTLSDEGSKLVDVLKTIGSWIAIAAKNVGKGISMIWSAVSDLSGNMSGLDLVTAFSYILNGAILVMIYKFVKRVKEGFLGFMDMWGSAKGTFDQLTDTLKTMQNSVKSKIILNIAIALGILAGSLWVLSTIPVKKLVPALGALAVTFYLLNGAMASMTELLKTDGFKSGKLIAIAAAMALLGFAMIEFATAVAILGNMKLETLAKGLVAIAISMKLMVTAMQSMNNLKGVVKAAAAMVIMAFALEAMAGVIMTFASIDIGTFVSGLVKMGAALAVLVFAMNSMPTSKMLGNSVGMVAIAGAMLLIAQALKAFASMSIGEIVKSVVTLAVVLGILVIAMGAMEGLEVGAGSMLVVAGAILVLSAALKMMGEMDLKDIGKSLLALAGALTILLLAGAAATFVGVGLLMLGGAVALLGVGLMAAGIGMALFAAGLATLVGLGTASLGVITLAIQTFLAMIPLIALQVAAGFVSFMQAIAAASPKIADAFVKIISSMISAANRLLPKLFGLFDNFLTRLLHSIDKHAPQFGHTFNVLLNTGLRVIENAIPRFVDTGMAVLEGLLRGIHNRMPRIMALTTAIIVDFINGIGNHMDSIITAGTNLIIHFVQGLGRNADRIANAAGQAIVDFLRGLRKAVDTYSPQINQEGQRLGVSIVQGVITGIGSLSPAGIAYRLGRDAIGALHNAIDNPPFPSGEGIKLGYSLAYGFTSGIASGHKGAFDASTRLALGSIAATANTLDINSPSKVFQSLGMYVSKGFVNGIMGSLNLVKAAGVIMARDTIDTITRTTTDLQLKADAQAAKADAIRFQAAIVRQKLHNKKLSKAQKAGINAQVKALGRAADAYSKASEATQRGVDAVNKREDDAREFASADTQGKADILNQRAQDAAASAEANRKNAIKLSEEANRIRKLDARRARTLSQQAAAALKNAERAANQAKTLASQAQGYAIQAVMDSSSTVANDLNSWLAEEEADRAYALMTTEEKKAEMERRSKADLDQSNALIQSARDKLAQASELARTNAEGAQALVDAAAADVEAAKAAKDKSEQEAEAAKGLVEDGVSGASQSSTDAKALADALKMPDMNIASSAVYGAQNMFDAYTKALSATTAAAEADRVPTVQFVQNNTSPVALSPTEVYRQTNNLLSNAERKLTGALT